jgi:hypothetical protein
LWRDGWIWNGGWYGDNGVHISTYTIKDLNSVSEIKQVCLDLICSWYTDYSKSWKSAIYTGRKAHCLSLTKQIQFYDYYSTLTEDNINNIKNEISACETEFSDENLYQIAWMKTCVVTEYDTIAPTSDIVK